MGINFLHVLLRAECQLDPGPNDEQKVHNQVLELVNDIGMNLFMEPRVKYMPDEGNAGLTWVVGLETSHASFHAWTKPNADIMKTENSTLIEMDCFTCGCLGEKELKVILKFLAEYKPKLISLAVFDRSKSDTFFEPIYKITYNKKTKGNYLKFIDNLKIDFTKRYKKKFLKLVA